MKKRGQHLLHFCRTHLRVKAFITIAIALFVMYTSIAFAATVLPGQGVDFEQVDFLFDEATVYDSDWGRVSADPVALFNSTGISSGYLNIYTDAGRVVQNLPVNLCDGSKPIAAYFTLGLTAPQDVSLLNAYVEFTSSPQLTFTDGPRSDFSVGVAGWNAEGAGDSHTTEIGEAPPANLVDFIPGGETTKYTQPNQNVQAATNQCFPMAFANSLQYLEEQFGLNVPHNHVPGLRGDNTLVGQLDLYANRWAPSRTIGGGVWFTPMVQGKFSYLADNGLAGSLIHRHRGRGYGTPPNQALPNGNFTWRGITSTDDGATVTWQWLCDQIRNGEDVELVWSYDRGNVPTGGHAVRIFECGTTLGRQWIGYLHDRLQTNWDPIDSRGLERVRVYVSDIDGDGILNAGSLDREIRFAMSESIKRDGPRCGDGVLNPGEQCDDGNNINGDGCSADCRLERWGKVNKHAYHFKKHQSNPFPVNDATVISSFWDWWLRIWYPPRVQYAWNRCTFPNQNNWVLGVWRGVTFYGNNIPYCTWCWFNVQFKAEIRPLTRSVAFFRWTKDGAYVGPWNWLGWRMASPPALYNHTTFPDDTTNTKNLVVRNLQFASSPTLIPNDETTLDNPLVVDLFSASTDPLRTGPFAVCPGNYLEPEPPLNPVDVPEPEIGGYTVLAKGEIWEEENQEWEPFVMQFIAEEDATLVDLVSFTARGEDGRVILQWQTASEIDNAGFNIWRKTGNKGEFIKINPTLIPAEGSPIQGATYTYIDTNVRNGHTYSYLLEDIDFNGVSTFHGKDACTYSVDPNCTPVMAKPHKMPQRKK